MKTLVLGAALLFSSMAHARDAAPLPNDHCAVGVYKLSDGRIIDVGHAKDGLRWRMADGSNGMLATEGATDRLVSTRGRTGRADGHIVTLLCADRSIQDGSIQDGSIQFDGAVGRHIALVQKDVTFRSGDVVLAGRLVLPAGPGPVPVVLDIHGSESTSALRYNAWQRLLPANGVGVFVYDKRGTGASGGKYTQDFHVLAGDAAMAAREARQLAGAQMSALVYAGASQGGWVAPLAQAKEPADRVIVSYGLTISPLEENRSQVLQELAAKGYSGADLVAAGEVADATGELMASGFKLGFAEYAAAYKRYHSAPWFKELGGEFTGALSAYSPLTLRIAAPIARRRSARGTPWRHQPLPVLSAVDVPVLWVLAGDDIEAPPAQTRDDLIALQQAGRDITLLEFPGTDHGIVEFELDASGKRVATREAQGFFHAVAEFARTGQLGAGTYGNAQRTGAAVQRGAGK